MARDRITKKWLKNHWHYSWWKYVVLTALCVMGTNMLFTMTAYRAPEEKKIEVYILNGYCDSVVMQQELEGPFFAAHPDQEELRVQNIDMGSGDMYAAMQFTTYTAAQQGDVCLIPAGEMAKMTAEGADYAFLELSPYIKSGVIDTTGIDMTRGIFQSSAGEAGVYGIPADTLRGLERLGNNPAGSYLCIMDYNGNDDNAAEMANLIIKTYRTDGQPQAEKPEILF